MYYLPTFSTYGTHVHGDELGSVFRGELLEPDDERDRVLASIRDVCRFRSWTLVAAHVRTSHVHVVAGGKTAPETRHGSTRYLKTDRAFAAAINYVACRGGREPRV